MEILIIGCGPGGSRAAALLASKGHSVTILDAQGPWEKPCGGGVTAKALEFDPVVGPISHVRAKMVSIRFGEGEAVRFSPVSPPAILSRRELAVGMLRAAQNAGARFVKDRALDLKRGGGRWRIAGRTGIFNADFLVGADGATSLVRQVLGVPFSPSELAVTLGYFIPASGATTLNVYFIPGFEGYLWSFPRPDHLSYGLITRPAKGWRHRASALLKDHIVTHEGPDALRGATRYSAPVPALGPEAWDRNVVFGDGWALLGDAAGLVDPITGEGIYYALRSAQLFAETFPSPERYGAAVAEECVPELACASRLYARFYGRFLGGYTTDRMVQFARRSPTLCAILGNLVAGTQTYHDLRRTLVGAAGRVAFEVAVSGLRRQ